MPKASALKVVKPLPVAPETPEQRLHRLIDQAGQIQQEETKLRRLKDDLRKEIESLMEIPQEVDEKTTVETAAFIATLAYAATKKVDPNKFFDYSPELFWRIVQVPLGTAEGVLSPEVFHEITTVEMSAAPKLSIRARKQR